MSLVGVGSFTGGMGLGKNASFEELRPLLTHVPLSTRQNEHSVCLYWGMTYPTLVVELAVYCDVIKTKITRYIKKKAKT